MARKPHLQYRADHRIHDDQNDDDEFRPGPNYLSQFRREMSEEDWVEAAAAFEAAVVTWLREEQERDQPLLPGLLPEP